MADIQQLSQDKGIATATLCHALDIPRASYYRHNNRNIHNNTIIPSCIPANKLTPTEQKLVLDILHSERFVDSSPYDVFYTLLDEGDYYCSIRTMYRLLEQRGENQDRRNQRNHRNAIKPELIAIKPNEVWSWDITKLLSTQRLVYYYLYVILDIYSRYVVGWLLSDNECQFLAKKLIQSSALKQGIQRGQLTLHADNGPSMTSGTVAQLLEHLGVIKSHNRPYTSNDNPFSESNFKTLKYCPQFPKRFDSFEQAEIFCQQFFLWYNSKHYHSGIAYLTPATVHFRQDNSSLEKRHQTLMQAYHDHPERFNFKQPKKKILTPVYINPPQTVQINAGQKEVNMD